MDKPLPENKIRAIRNFRGYSSKRVGKKIGLSGTALIYLETGKTKLTEDHIVLLAKALNCTKEQLLGFEEVPGLKEFIEQLELQKEHKELLKKNSIIYNPEYIGYSLEIMDALFNVQEMNSKIKSETLHQIYEIVYGIFNTNTTPKELEEKILENKRKLAIMEQVLNFLK